MFPVCSALSIVSSDPICSQTPYVPHEILMRYDPSFSPAVTYYYQQDHEGSVTHLLNTSGNVIESYKYDAFGAPAIYDGNGTQLSSSAYSNRFLFTGREYTNLFGFYEYRARAYHPGLGRFMSEDPKLFDAGDYNFFRYCHNDPIDFTDPMGLDEAAPTHSPRETSQERADITNAERISLSQKSMESSIGGEVAYQNLQSANMARAGSSEKGRSLTGRETNEARGVFHQKIKYDPVRVVAGKYVPWQPNNIAITPDNRIFWPKAPGDLVEAGLQDRFIHEMTHVMQHQHGVNVVASGLFLQAAYRLSFHRYDPYHNYRYDPNRAFSSYNIEAQGNMAVDIYHHFQPNNIDYSDF